MSDPRKESTPVHPRGPAAVGPAYHPNDPEYVIRWHQHRGDVPGDAENLHATVWRDASGAVIDHTDFPPPAPKKFAKKAAAKKEAVM